MENEFTTNAAAPAVDMTNDTVKEARRQFSKVGLMFFLGTLIIYGVQILAMTIANIINPNAMNDTASSLLITMLPMYAIAMPIMGLLIRTAPARKLEKKKMSVGQWLIAFCICYGAVFISNYIGLFLTSIIGAIKGSPVSNTIVDVATSSTIGVNFLIMVIGAPIAEELLFRKLLIDRTIKYGDCVASLFSGLMDGLFHGNLTQFAYAFALGVCYGFIYIKTGNVRYTIALHMLNNFISSVLGMLVLKFVGEDFINAMNDPAAMMPYMMEHMGTTLFYFAYVFILFGVALAGIILFCVFFKKIKAQIVPGEVAIPKGKRFTTTVLNIGMGLFFLFWIAIIIMQLFSA